MNHKSKAQEILQEKCMCEVNAALSGVKHICFVCDVAKALAEAELSGARKMREKASEESKKWEHDEKTCTHQHCEYNCHAKGWNEARQFLSEKISQLSPESVVEG